MGDFSTQPHKEMQFIPDVTSAIREYRRYSRSVNSTIALNSFSPSVSDTLSKFACKRGEFGINDEAAYRKALSAQVIADANGDKKLSGSEIEIFNALNDLYKTPEVGGVKLDSATLSKIEHISKNADGNYEVQFKPETNMDNFIFSPQDKTKQARLSLDGGSKLVFASSTPKNIIDNWG